MQIIVQPTQGSSFTLEVENSDTIDAVKAFIQDARGIPVVDQRLFYLGTEMDDGRTLADYGVASGGTVQLVVPVTTTTTTTTTTVPDTTTTVPTTSTTLPATAPSTTPPTATVTSTTAPPPVPIVLDLRAPDTSTTTSPTTGLTEATTPTTATSPPATTAASTGTGPTSTVDTTALESDGQFTVRGSGYRPETTVRGVLHSTPLDLGSETVGADGTFTMTRTLPPGFETGPHTVALFSTGADGRAHTESLAFVVPGIRTATTATAGIRPTALAFTGADAIGLGSAGLLLTVVGACIVRRTRIRLPPSGSQP